MRDIILISLSLLCLYIGMKLAFVERGYFAIGCEYLFAFIPVGFKYIFKGGAGM